MVDLSICIPAHNEDATLAQTVSSVVHAIPPKMTWQIVLVDDASSDATQDIMRLMQVMYPNNTTIVSLREQQGLGGALSEGFAHSTGRIVTWLPADGEYAARDVLSKVPNDLNSDLNPELIIFKRSRREQPARNVLSLALNLSVRTLYGINLDDFCGIFVVQRSALEVLNIRSRSTVFTIEVLIRATRRGWTISGERIEWRPRDHGKSSVFTLRGVLTSISDLAGLKLRWQAKSY